MFLGLLKIFEAVSGVLMLCYVFSGFVRWS